MTEEMPETVTEYAGTVPTTNTVQPKDEKLLSTSEKLRLTYGTGQQSDTEAPRKSGFMYGVDPDFPDNPKARG